LQANPPDVVKIPVVDALGVTVVLLTCSYRQQEFVRVGYFINNEYTEPELRENPPAQPQFDKVSIELQDASNNSDKLLVFGMYVSLGS
jgi:histone chaperone ASF1